jgi:hypothetical protein
MARERSFAERIAIGVACGLLAGGLAYALRPRAKAPSLSASSALATLWGRFELSPDGSQLTVRSRDGLLVRTLGIQVVVDGTPRPPGLSREDLVVGADSLRAAVHVPLGDSVLEAELRVRADAEVGALVMTLHSTARTSGHHTLALKAELQSEGQPVFVPGVGSLADRANVSGSSLLVDAEPHPLGILSSAGPISIEATPEDAVLPVQPMHLSVTSAPDSDEGHAADLYFVVAESSGTIWRIMAQIGATPTAPIRGRVTGTTERSLVFGLDAREKPTVRVHVGDDGAFALDVPITAVVWYAAVDPGRASGLLPFIPGTPGDLVLDVPPGGDLHVTIVDADTHTLLTARLLVHGVDGTVDPNFGPDYRASGAGPVIDALRGEVSTPLPSGRYRVAATRGIEWSIDAKVVDIGIGRVTDVRLAPRHVVPTPGVIGCDLHVHARPSFDTPVTPEDRVLSLVAAGVDFAVPTEHNIVGDYSLALETLELGNELYSVPGIEVTTYGRGFGHFGVFPYEKGTPVPPFRHTNMAAIFRSVRGADPDRYFQLNHPRLPKGIGYFNNINFDPNGPRSQLHNRIDFDGIEVFNGYDSERPERVEEVLKDYWALLDFGFRYTATGSSDSHRIQFHWAGYPRTMVTVDPNATTESDSASIDRMAVVANVKRGHAVVTIGPMIELSLGGAHPGDETVTTDDPVRAHLRVRAAPWIDVTRIEVVAGQVGGSSRVVLSHSSPGHPLEIGNEPGTLEEAAARTIRFDEDIDVPVGPNNGWIQVIALGERRMDDILPFMPVPPLAFTNPIYVVRRPAPPPQYPGSGAPKSTP